jgi:hypothetical protein
LYFSGVTYTTTGYGDLVLPKEWRLVGGNEMHCPTQAVGLHQTTPLPEFRANVFACYAGHAHADRYFSGGHHLRVDTAYFADYGDEVGLGSWLQQGVPVEPPSPHLRPGERSHRTFSSW